MSKLLKSLMVAVAAISLSACSFPFSKKEEQKEEEPSSEVIPSEPSEPSEPVDPVDPVEPEGTKVSFSEAVSFFSEAGIEVVIPEMEVASSEALVETDDSFEGYFDYYVTGATHEEMVSFKGSCESSGWSVIGESEGDYRLQFGETLAGCDLIDMEEYIWISFFVGSDTPVESHTAEEIARLFNEAISVYELEASYYEVSSFTGWWLGVYLSESEDDSEASLQSAAYTLASFLPECVGLLSEEYTAASEESDAEYSMFLVSEDYSVGIEVYGYLDSGYLSAEIYIYDLAE